MILYAKSAIGLLSAMLLVLTATFASAQERRGDAAGRPARGGADKRFEQAKPAVGDMLPDVGAFDENGQKLKLRDLKGQYTVIVFGCLT